jgi:hypothetical protein
MSRRFEVGDVVRYLKNDCENFTDGVLFMVVKTEKIMQSKIILINIVIIDENVCSCCSNDIYNKNRIVMDTMLELVQTNIERERSNKLKELLNNE